MTKPARMPRQWPLRLFAILTLLIGGVMVAGGMALLRLGGSPYYLAAGLCLTTAAVLLWKRDRRGSWLYGAFLAGTGLWSLIEVGFDGWALMPRLAGPAVIGGFLLLPVIRDAMIQPPLRRMGIASALLAAGLCGSVIWQDYVKEPPIAASGTDTPERASVAAQASADSSQWTAWGRDQEGTRFSPLSQIDTGNVHQLEIAWQAHLGAAPAGVTATLEVTPLMVEDRLFACNGLNTVTALEATTGKILWVRELRPSAKGLLVATCRGVAYFRDPAATPGSLCAARIITATVDARLVALDAADGKFCQDFGDKGNVDLKRGMGTFPAGYYHVSSAPTIARGRVIIGGWVTDNQYSGEPSGVVRAFDARTGKFAWAWDIGRPGITGEPQAPDHYTRGTPNSWAPASVDEKLGLVYLPTGNATPDFWTRHRTAEMNRFSSSVVALDSQTGEVRWSFQTVHRDVWDYDVASQPTLIDWPVAGNSTVPALIQPTKRGQLFILDRRTGRPLVPVVERRVPLGAAPGELLSLTQPYSTMPSLAGPPLRERDMWGLTPLDQMWCRLRFREARYEGEFTPPGLKASIQFPGYVGGFNWGGVSVDPERQIIFANFNQFANYGSLLTREEANKRGIRIFTGGGARAGEEALGKPMIGTPFAADFNPFLSPLGVPCQKPPFGEIAAIDMRTHRVLWRKPLGTARDSGPLGYPTGLSIPLGTPSLGGSVLTRSGLAFIAATQEREFRAIETETGKILWRTRLPASGNANPMTYLGADGRQYVVIAAGGAVMLGGPTSDQLIAFALPRGAIKLGSARP